MLACFRFLKVLSTSTIFHHAAWAGSGFDGRTVDELPYKSCSVLYTTIRGELSFRSVRGTAHTPTALSVVPRT